MANRNEPLGTKVREATRTGEQRAGEIVAANDWIVGQVKMDFIEHFVTQWVALWRHKWHSARANGIRSRHNSEAEIHAILTKVSLAVWQGPPPRDLYIPGGFERNGRGAYIYPTPRSTRLFTNGELLTQMNQDVVRHVMQGNANGVWAIQSGTLETSTPPPPQGTSGSASRQGSPFDVHELMTDILNDPENDPQHYSRNENSESPPPHWHGTAKAWGKTPASGQGGVSSSSWNALYSRVSNSALQTGYPLPQPYPPHSAAPHHDSSRKPRAIAPAPISGYRGILPAPTGGHQGILPAPTGTPQHTIAPAAGEGRGYGQGSVHPNPVSRGRGGNPRGRPRGRPRGSGRGT